jgi:hypothetical protein
MSSRCLAGLGFVLGCCLLVPATRPVQGQQDDDIGGLKGSIARAKGKAIAFLQRMQARSGEWEGDFPAAARDNNKLPGATALCALALMENGISVQDKSIQSAADVVRRTMRNPEFNYNYSICSAILFLHRLHGGENVKHADAPMIRELAGKVIAGQADDGGWSYRYPGQGSDNSNTQFAAIALWIARNYQVQGVNGALAGTALRFRNSQKASGGWGYTPGPPNARGFATGSMTCAALLGLALDAGLQREALQAKFKGEGGGGELEPVVSNLARDKQIVAARTYLASVVLNLGTDKSEELHPAYFLWSLERVATLYRWSKLDDVNWYAKGAEYLIAKQQGDGSWDLDKAYPAHIDTAFALLFLAKTNMLGSLETAVFHQGSFGSAAPKSPEKPKTPPTPEEMSKRAQELFANLVNALPTDRPALLEEIEKLPGQEYDLLLAQTIAKLPGPAQKQARDTLKRRLARLPGKSLAVYINGRDNRELRLAAIQAAPSLTDQEFIRDLIPLVENPDMEISEAAHQALVAISHLHLPKSVKAWTRWYEMGAGKKK